MAEPWASYLQASALEAALSQALRDTLFHSGLSISPRRVNQFGQEMRSAFVGFCQERNGEQAVQLGNRFARDGLGPKSILSVTEALRRTCREESSQSIELADLAGDREQQLLEVQERTRRAHEAAVVRQQNEAFASS